MGEGVRGGRWEVGVLILRLPPPFMTLRSWLNGHILRLPPPPVMSNQRAYPSPVFSVKPLTYTP